MRSKDMKRVTFRVSNETLEKMEAICERYGISINALCSYVMGRWVEENYDLQDKMLDKFAKAVISESVFDRMVENPFYRKVLEDVARVALEKAEAEERKAQSEA